MIAWLEKTKKLTWGFHWRRLPPPDDWTLDLALYRIPDELSEGSVWEHNSWFCFCSSCPTFFSPVLQIHDMLVWIRIRIRGSMHLTNGSGSCYFHHWSLNCQKNCLPIFSAYYFLKVHFRHFSKMKSQDANKKLINSKKVFLLISFQQNSHKRVGIKVFWLFLHDDRRIRIRIHTSD
jgi:hypothetical protein